MELSSYIFIFIFLPITFFLSVFIPVKYKKYYLLFISLLFVFLLSWKAFLVLTILTLINYLISKKLKKKFYLVLGIILNVLLLIVFKYSNFFLLNINMLFHLSIPVIEFFEIVGLSFLVFQNISFLVDVYKSPKSVSLVDYALYSFYFPRVNNGPILRFDDFELQISNLKKVTYDSLYEGIKRIAFGMGKVLIISYIFGNIWDNIYTSYTIGGLSISVAWLGIIAYSMFLYYNFSGFIDISIGVSRLFGIVLPENFDVPYSSKSVSEFWRRWHISLSSWFKDYIYIPLGGNRKGHVYLNIMIVFLVTGIWHGSSWNFIIWGVFHGIINIIDKKLRNFKIYNVVPSIIKVLITYILVLIGWVLFASNGLMASFNYLKYMFGLLKPSLSQYNITYFVNLYNIFFLGIAFFMAFGLHKKLTSKLSKKTLDIIEPVWIIIVLVISIVFLINNSYFPSLYANF